mmetsp:Transcript_40622/g.91634  ORF Transcript_40622/g.91634 Transcript_40622/m.91634 type:complete len:462 (+) Transcript_40622:92-1477(+)
MQRCRSRLLALEELHDPLLHLRVRLDILCSQGLLRDGAHGAAVLEPLVERLLLEVVPVRRPQRVDHHLAVDGAAHVVGAVDHRPRFDPDLALLLLLLLLLLQRRKVAQERRAGRHRLRRWHWSVHLGRKRLVEGAGRDVAGGERLQLVALDQGLQLGGVNDLLLRQGCACQWVRAVARGPVLQLSTFEDMTRRRGHGVVHQGAAELALGLGWDTGLIRGTQVALPTFCRDERWHVVVVRVLLLRLLGRRGRGLLAVVRALHREQALALLGLVLRAAPAVLADGLAGGHRLWLLALLASRWGQREGQHLPCLDRGRGERQPHSLLGRQPALEPCPAVERELREGVREHRQDGVEVDTLGELDVDSQLDQQLKHGDVLQEVGDLANLQDHVVVPKLGPEDVDVEGHNHEGLQSRFQVLPLDHLGPACRGVVQRGEDVEDVWDHDVLHDGAVNGKVLPQLLLVL